MLYGSRSRRQDPGLSAEEEREIDENQPPRAAVLHETIRIQGDHELERSVAALWWSALAAGLTMGLSLMAMGLFKSRLEGIPGSHVISSLGYSAGFRGHPGAPAIVH